ncbi:lipopolysaccharide biosynthesis protein [Lignipirellula cremea]|uniref:MurJ-like flippase n=1 Tax=Lignipirellula cremea TaxID=2528010 RepID=A0A518E583_9BACT|nr:oligosaccharide flippase family protein [Lignipirellula cremea]QDU99237.1 MurJ-like flippase [Lignipirellula cremea]
MNAPSDQAGSVTPADSGSPVSLPTDSLALGMAFMLAMTILQRLIGFGRNVVFCRLLTDEQLGQWSLAFSFLMLAAPLAVLGLPGSFGRYAEYYHRRGQLRPFLRRTTIVSTLLGLLGVSLLFCASEAAAWVVFKERSLGGLVRWLAVALACAIVFNFINELLIALRQVRASSVMQFVHSMLFTLLGVSLLAGFGGGVSSLVTAYVVACLGGMAAAIWFTRSCFSSLSGTTETALSHRDLWSKLIPFAGWVWVINLLSNLFDAADRYMILHFAQGDTSLAQSLVGQYHSSRVTPLLLVSLAGMLGGVILPYLSHEWEVGRQQLVARRVLLALKLLSLGFTLAGVGILLGSPWLFAWALNGRYAEGLAVMPGTTAYCVWFSLLIVTQNYLWCAEKAKLASLALFLGLILNFSLNAVLVPWWGLPGAVAATAAANATALVLLLGLSSRSGMKMDCGGWCAALLPILLLGGPLPGAIGLLAFVLLAMPYRWYFSQEDRVELDAAFRLLCDKLRHRTRLSSCPDNQP